VLCFKKLESREAGKPGSSKLKGIAESSKLKAESPKPKAES